MAELTWDDDGNRFFENGVDHAVLYLLDENGEYTDGVAWNGITTITGTPSGAEPTPFYADNIKYAELFSAEEYAVTIEAYTYPDEFELADGTAEIAPGVTIGQQRRRKFGLHYRTLIGNDINPELGYKLNLAYGLTASPSERTNATINESPELNTLSWEATSTKIAVPGKKPTATVTINSITADKAKLAALEDILFGTTAEAPRLPKPSEIITLMGGPTTFARMASFSTDDNGVESFDDPDATVEPEGQPQTEDSASYTVDNDN